MGSVQAAHLTQVTCSLSSWSSVFASPILSVWMQHQNQNLKPNQNPGGAVPILAILHTMVGFPHTMVAIPHTMVAISFTMVAIPHTLVAIGEQGPVRALTIFVPTDVKD